MINVSELTGHQLSYWFLIALGTNAYIDESNVVYREYILDNFIVFDAELDTEFALTVMVDHNISLFHQHINAVHKYRVFVNRRNHEYDHIHIDGNIIGVIVARLVIIECFGNVIKEDYYEDAVID